MWGLGGVCGGFLAFSSGLRVMGLPVRGQFAKRTVCLTCLPAYFLLGGRGWGEKRNLRTKQQKKGRMQIGFLPPVGLFALSCVSIRLFFLLFFRCSLRLCFLFGERNCPRVGHEAACGGIFSGRTCVVAAEQVERGQAQRSCGAFEHGGDAGDIFFCL